MSDKLFNTISLNQIYVSTTQLLYVNKLLGLWLACHYIEVISLWFMVCSWFVESCLRDSLSQTDSSQYSSLVLSAQHSDEHTLDWQ